MLPLKPRVNALSVIYMFALQLSNDIQIPKDFEINRTK